MEHPHDPYHVRPFPSQPHRGGKAFKTALGTLETVLSSDLPDFETLHLSQEHLHKAANTFNDDRLVDLIRQLSTLLDQYKETPEKALREKILKQILKLRIELKKMSAR